MCTRYALEKDLPELKDIIDAASRSRLVQKFIDSYARPFITYGEVHPTDIVPVLAPNPKGERSAYPMQWGFPKIIRELFSMPAWKQQVLSPLLKMPGNLTDASYRLPIIMNGNTLKALMAKKKPVISLRSSLPD